MSESGPLLLTVKETSALLNISKNTCYSLIQQDIIPHVRLGRRVLISKVALKDWIARESGMELAEPTMLCSSPRH